MKRRCEWCAVRLRWWQIAYCRNCNHALSEGGLYLQNGGPPAPHRGRADAEPDRFWP